MRSGAQGRLRTTPRRATATVAWLVLAWAAQACGGGTNLGGGDVEEDGTVEALDGYDDRGAHDIAVRDDGPGPADAEVEAPDGEADSAGADADGDVPGADGDAEGGDGDGLDAADEDAEAADELGSADVVDLPEVPTDAETDAGGDGDDGIETDVVEDDGAAEIADGDEDDGAPDAGPCTLTSGCGAGTICDVVTGACVIEDCRNLYSLEQAQETEIRRCAPGEDRCDVMAYATCCNPHCDLTGGCAWPVPHVWDSNSTFGYRSGADTSAWLFYYGRARELACVGAECISECDAVCVCVRPGPCPTDGWCPDW